MDVQFEARAREVALLRRKSDLDRLTYRRRLAELAPLGTQRDIAQALGVSQPNLSKTLKTAAATPPVVEGFSGASPYEIAERFAVGELTLSELVEQLLRWEYLPGQQTDGYDDLLFDVPGSWDDVSNARDDKLIDGQTYDFVLRAGGELDAAQEAAGLPYRGFTVEEAREAAARFVESRAADAVAGAA